MSALIQMAHASGLHEVARELGRLRQSHLRTVDDDTRERAMHLSVMSLVAVCATPELADVVTDTVGHLASSHPTRAIIVTVRPDGPPSIEADLAIQEGTGAHHAELVRLTVSGPPARHLSSVITPLLVADVPVYLWIVGAPPIEQAFSGTDVPPHETIVDTGSYQDLAYAFGTVAAALGRGDSSVVKDLAWARTRTWREVLAQSFDPAGMRPFVHHIRRATIAVAGTSPSAQAWLVAGWLVSRLRDVSDTSPSIAIERAGEGSVATEGEIVSVRLECVHDGSTATVRVERHEAVLYTAFDVDGTVSASRTMPMVEADVVHLVGGLLEEAGDDPVYRAALAEAARLLPTERT
jgi:glucose-6-phosphate dehydrogenase assembly protein OpcA